MRLSYSWDAIRNRIEILDRNDYYPFGMNFVAAGAGAVYDPKGSPLNYKFGTKELQETGFYDFGARMLMPDIGRWFTIDPLAEKNRKLTPYHYAANNPIRNIDPDGRMELNFTGESAKEAFVQLRDAQTERSQKNVQKPPGDYYDSLTGKHVYNDGKKDGKVYIRSQTNVMGVIKNVDELIGQKDKIPDKTKEFKLQLEKTNAYFSKWNNEFEGGFKEKLEFFASKVGNNKVFDLKKNINTPFYNGKYENTENKNFYKGYAFFDGQLFRFDDFGNFNYGVAGKAFGLSDTALEAAAGINQIGNSYKYGSPVGGLASYGDDPKDNEMVKQGINYYKTNY